MEVSPHEYGAGDIIKEIKLHREEPHKVSAKDQTPWQQKCAASAAEVSNVQRWTKPKRVDEDSQDSAAEPSPSDTLLADWVVVEEPGPEESRLVPFMNDDDGQGLGTVARTAAIGGAAGLLLMGPISGAVIVAGTVGACSEPGQISAAARDAVRWVRYSSPSAAECSQAYGLLAGRAKQALGEVRRLPEKLSPGLASVCSSLSGSAMAERDMLIQRLQTELEASSRHSLEEKARIEELQGVEKLWRDQSVRLTSQLADAEQSVAEEQRRHHRDLKAAHLAKDEEVSRLAKELETTEQIWQQDTGRLTRELEHHRRERLDESKRLTSELADAARAQDAELAKLQKELLDAEHAQAVELEAKERTENELEAARRHSEEETELKRCCVCFEDERHILFLPCRHVSCCRTCARSLDKCPIDRVTITQKIDFIMA